MGAAPICHRAVLTISHIHSPIPLHFAEPYAMRITVESRINPTPRALQTASLFDLESGRFSRVVWDVDLPLDEKPWQVGLITGPSGCGKSTIARKLFKSATWLDGLPD